MKGYKRLSIGQFRKLGHDSLDGQIVEFNPPLYIYGYEKDKKQKDGSTRISIFPRVQSNKPIGRFMKVEGGFGSSFACSGRMIIGTYYQTLADADKNNKIGMKGYKVGGNTKEYPSFVWIKTKRSGKNEK